MQPLEGQKKKFSYGYIIVGIAFLVNLMIGGTTYTFSVFFEPLSSEFGWTRALTSGAFSLYMILHGFLYIVTGKLNDKFGPRVVLSMCGFFMGLGFLLMPLVSEIWHLYIFYGVIIAVGMSGGYVPITSTVTRWFENSKRRGLMIGISVAGIGIGTMIVPPFANWLIATYGWRNSYIIIGLLVLVLIITAAQFMKRRPDEPKKQDADTGQVPGFAQLNVSQVVKTKQFWLLSIAYFGFGLCLQATMVHIVLHALGLKISEISAANIFIFIGGLSVAGRILMGTVCDRIGIKTVIIINFALLTAAFVWLLFAGNMGMLIIFACVFGFAYGGLVAIQSPIIADLFGIKSHGVTMGLIVFIVTVGGAIGPLMAGAIFDFTESYFPVFLICAVFSIIGLILILFLKPTAEKIAGIRQNKISKNN